MQGEQVSGAFARPTRHDGGGPAGVATPADLRRAVDRQWRAVGVLRAAKDAAASRELAALRTARAAERALRELELQAAPGHGAGSRPCP